MVNSLWFKALLMAPRADKCVVLAKFGCGSGGSPSAKNAVHSDAWNCEIVAIVIVRGGEEHSRF